MQLPSAMVLGAGFGTRLRPLTDVLPKPLMPVLGRPAAGYGLLSLRSLGTPHIVVNGHHLADRLETLLGAWAGRRLHGVKLHFSREEDAILGTGGGLLHARHHFPADRPILVLNGDVLQDVNLPALLRAHYESGAEATLVGVAHPRARTYGGLTRDASGRLVQLAAHARAPAPAPEVGEPMVFTGVHILSPSILDRLPSQGASCIVRQGYAPLLAEGGHIHLFEHRGTWLDLGNPRGYLDAHLALLDGALALPLIEQPDVDPGLLRARALLQEFAWAVDGQGHEVGSRSAVAVPPSVELRPPFAFGPGVTIGAGAKVSRAVLGAGTMIGQEAVIDRVLTWAGVAVLAEEQIEDSIVAVLGGRRRVVPAEERALLHEA